MEVFFMSPPGPRWALRGRANFRSESAPQVDAALARREWLSLAREIEARGGRVISLKSPDDALTGMPYAAECGQLIETAKGQGFLLPNMATPHRQAERKHWKTFVELLGLRTESVPEGVWEAQGDVAEMNGVTLLFFGGRTDERGMRHAARFFAGETLALRIREPAFHGNMAVLPLPSVDRLLVAPSVLADESWTRLRGRFGGRIIEVTEAELRCYATNGLPLGRDVLVPTVAPKRISEMLQSLGLKVVPLAMTELCEKGGGGPRCLVSRAIVSGLRIPPEARLEAIAREIEG